MLIVLEDIATGFSRYFAHVNPEATGVSIVNLRRIHGGASRETYLLNVSWTEQGTLHARDVCLRRDPPSSLIETSRSTEFDAYAAFQGTAVPVPVPLYLETEPNEWLERPFFVMEAIMGCESDARLFNQPPFCDHKDRIGERMWGILGEIAKTDPRASGLAEKWPAPALDRCWSRELDYWERVIDEDELEPQPVVRAAIRRLRREPPPGPKRLGVVHGDYRTGNFLFDRSGDIRAILDWEMCHLGDPLEDLGWATDPLWGWPTPERPGHLIPREDALRIWREASGIAPDPHALWWWQTFSSVKGMAIWLSSAREYHDGRNRDPMMIFPSWFCTALHNRILAERLAPKGIAS